MSYACVFTYTILVDRYDVVFTLRNDYSTSWFWVKRRIYCSEPPAQIIRIALLEKCDIINAIFHVIAIMGPWQHHVTVMWWCIRYVYESNSLQCDTRTSWLVMAQTKVIIIGAGLAGLSAAQRLITNGFRNVHIIEAKNRIGGRVLTQSHGRSWLVYLLICYKSVNTNFAFLFYL